MSLSSINRTKLYFLCVFFSLLSGFSTIFGLIFWKKWLLVTFWEKKWLIVTGHEKKVTKWSEESERIKSSRNVYWYDTLYWGIKSFWWRSFHNHSFPGEGWHYNAISAENSYCFQTESSWGLCSTLCIRKYTVFCGCFVSLSASSHSIVKYRPKSTPPLVLNMMMCSGGRGSQQHFRNSVGHSFPEHVQFSTTRLHGHSFELGRTGRLLRICVVSPFMRKSTENGRFFAYLGKLFGLAVADVVPN